MWRLLILAILAASQGVSANEENLVGGNNQTNAEVINEIDEPNQQEVIEQEVPKILLKSAHLLDEEIATTRALIAQYDQKIALLEEK